MHHLWSSVVRSQYGTPGNLHITTFPGILLGQLRHVKRNEGMSRRAGCHSRAEVFAYRKGALRRRPGLDVAKWQAGICIEAAVDAALPDWPMAWQQTPLHKDGLHPALRRQSPYINS